MVGENHDLLQARRIEQKSEAFKERMHQRNGIEGTISELTRAHGMRRNRYRGLAKARFQNLFIATACNIKRWLKLERAKTDENASYFPADLRRPGACTHTPRPTTPLAFGVRDALSRGTLPECRELATVQGDIRTLPPSSSLQPIPQ